MQNEVIILGLSLLFYFYIPVITILEKNIITVLHYKNKYLHNGRENVKLANIFQKSLRTYVVLLLIFLRILDLDINVNRVLFLFLRLYPENQPLKNILTKKSILVLFFLIYREDCKINIVLEVDQSNFFLILCIILNLCLASWYNWYCF